MRPDLIGPVGLALATIGGGLQFLRAQRVAKDRWVMSLGVLTALGLWALAVDWWHIADWQRFWIVSIPEAGTLVSAMFGGTFAVSSAAKALVKAGVSPDRMYVPLTDSKGSDSSQQGG